MHCPAKQRHGVPATAAPFFGDAEDLPWKPFTARLIQSTRAAVVPVYFSGQNSRLFQLASHVSEVLRLSLVIHELYTRIGSTLRVRIGTPIAHEAIAHLDDAVALTQHLRARTLVLAP